MKGDAMKKIITLLLFLFLINNNQAQVAENTWVFGVGGFYPAFMNHNINYSSGPNYGGYFSMEYRITRNSGLSITPKFVHLRGKVTGFAKKIETNLLMIALDYKLHILPAQIINPYVSAGVAPIFFVVNDAFSPGAEGSNFGFQVNAGVGMELYLGKDVSLNTEVNYYTPFTDEIDGAIGAGAQGGILGGNYDSFLTAELGVKYFFSRGEPLPERGLPGGIKETQEKVEPIDYDRIEEIVKRHVPQKSSKETDDAEAIKSAKDYFAGMGMANKDNWVLVGVTFETDKAVITPDSYQILFHATKVLLKNPELVVEVQGHTDNIGSAAYNQKLSEKRAKVVMEYLIKHGVNPKRLFAKGYGETKPIADNRTALGRATNRRIEFKVLSE